MFRRYCQVAAFVFAAYGIGAIYGVLGVFGWFIDGHLALAIPAVAIVAIDAVTARRRSPQASPA